MPGMYPYGVATFGSAPLLAGDPFDAGVTRYVAEVIASNDSYNPTLTRYIAEVIADSFTGVGGVELRTTRYVAEVIGSPAEFSAARPTVTRYTAEAIGDSVSAQRGLDLPPAGYTNSTVLAVVAPLAGGTVRISGDTVGLAVTPTSVTWGPSSGTASIPDTGAVVAVRQGTDIRVDGTALTLTGGTPTGPFLWRDIGVTRATDDEVGGYVAEVMIFNRVLSDPEIEYLEAYLTCKWLSGGTCNIYSDLPIPP